MPSCQFIFFSFLISNHVIYFSRELDKDGKRRNIRIRSYTIYRNGKNHGTLTDWLAYFLLFWDSTSIRLDKAVTHLLGSFSLHIYLKKGNFLFFDSLHAIGYYLPTFRTFFLVLFFCFTCVCLGLMAAGYRLYTYGREYTRVTSC